MNIRKLSALGLLVSTFLVAAHGAAETPKTLDVRVDKVDVKEGKVHAALRSGSGQNILPGDKGFFTKDGSKVEGSDFEIDRVGESLAFAKTGFKSNEELRAQTSMKTRITTTHTCPRGGGVRPNLDDKEVSMGQEPAEGFAFAKVTASSKVHKTEIEFTIDKGSDDGVLPSSAGYALLSGEGRTLAYYVHIEWVSAKTAGGKVTAGDADAMMEKVKRIAFQRLVCK
jgi:hypothetical protein